MKRSTDAINQSDVMILHSGGIDSTALIPFYQNLGFKPTSLFVDYGQSAKKNELISVKNVCKHYKLPSKIVQIISPIKFESGEVLGRNLFLISTALMFSKMKTGLIAIGVHAGTEYIDCNEAFAKACNEILLLYTSGKVILATPFLQMSKAAIIQYCKEENVPLKLTSSCERGGVTPCGKCGTCKELNTIYAR